MNIREQIIQRLDKQYTAETINESGISYYRELKQCLNTIPEQCGTKSQILDDWFRGVIESLYYRPNKYVLVLEGKQGIGKTYFFRRLFPRVWDELCLYTEIFNSDLIHYLIYDNLTVSFDEGMSKKDLNLPNEDNFKVNEDISKLHFEYESNEDFVNNLLTVHGFSSCDKRLASYCCTTNKWQFPQRKNYIILHLESINQELFNSIDKELLWI